MIEIQITEDMKNKKYDNMDLARSIRTGNIRDASFSKRDVLKHTSSRKIISMF